MTCAKCGYEGTIAEFEEKAQEVESQCRKEAKETGDKPDQGLYSSVRCPECSEEEFLVAS